MNSSKHLLKIGALFNYSLFILPLLIVLNSCSDLVETSKLIDEKYKNELSAELRAELEKLENPISKNPKVIASEKHFSELSKELRSLAGYYIDPQDNPHVSDDKLVLLLVGENTSDNNIQKALDYINSRFGKSFGNFDRSRTVIKRAKYNFNQLVAFRDVLHEPLLNTPGVTSIDLSENINRIQIGVASDTDVNVVDNLISNLPIPNEAVDIEVEGYTIPAIGYSEINEEYNSPPSLLTHLTLRNTYRPLMSGLRLTNLFTSNISTLGPIVNYGGNAAFLTAAHSSKTFGQMNSDNYDQGQSFIGTEIVDPNFIEDPVNNRAIRYSDAAMNSLSTFDFEFSTVAFTNGRGYNWGDKRPSQLEILDTDPGPVLKFVDEEISLIGLPVAKTGQTTGTTVGYILKSCITLVGARDPGNFSDDYYQLVCQSTASPLYGETGDSGAPVYTDYVVDIDGGEAKLVGLFWGVNHAKKYSAFTQLNGIRNDLEIFGNRISFFPFNVGIFGFENIDRTGNYTYDTVVEHPVGTVNYQWSIRWEGSNTWNSLGSNSNQTISGNSSNDFTLKVHVSDDNNSDTVLFPVTVVTEECTPWDPCIGF